MSIGSKSESKRLFLFLAMTSPVIAWGISLYRLSKGVFLWGISMGCFKNFVVFQNTPY